MTRFLCDRRGAESRLQILEETLAQERCRSQHLSSVQKRLIENIETILRDNDMEEELLDIKKVFSTIDGLQGDQAGLLQYHDPQDGNTEVESDSSRSTIRSKACRPRDLVFEISEKMLEFIEARADMKEYDMSVILDDIARLKRSLTQNQVKQSSIRYITCCL